MVKLPSKDLYTLPISCRKRGKSDPCKRARVHFEREIARLAGGFTRIRCDGAFLNRNRLQFDRNFCYIVFGRGSAQQVAIRLAYDAALKESEEEFGFHERNGATIIPRRRDKQSKLV